MIKLKLYKICINKRMSQSKLSRLTGISQSYISKIESGTQTPTLEIINKIAKTLDVCPIHDLLECDCSKCQEKRKSNKGE